MRKSLGALAAGVLTLSTVGLAQANVMGWEGTLELQLTPLPPAVSLPPMVFTHASGTFGGAGVSLNGSSGLGHLTTLQVPPQDLQGLGGIAVVPLTDPLGGSLPSLRATAFFGGGTFASISGGAASAGPLTQNIGPVPGVIKLCLFMKGCQFFLPIPLTVGGTRGVGLGGLATFGGFAAAGVKVSVLGAPWTVKTAVISSLLTTNGGFGTVTAKGFAHGPESSTSSTANIGGVVQLVTPALVATSAEAVPLLPLFGTLTIHIVPEPGTLLLFGSGIAALGIAARRRNKK